MLRVRVLSSQRNNHSRARDDGPTNNCNERASRALSWSVISIRRDVKRIIILCILSALSVTSLISCTYNPVGALKSHLKPNSYLYSEKTFIAMQYYAGILNRTVKVYVLEDLLSVTTIGGPLATPVFVTEEWYDPNFYIDQTLASELEKFNPLSKPFLLVGKTNYQIQRSSIARVEYDPTDKWGMGSVPHSGKILVQIIDGNEHEFILLGSQDGAFVKAMIEQTMWGKR